MNYLFKQTYEVLQNLIDYIETHVFNKIGAAGGLATLNEDGKVPNSQIGIEPMTQAEASEGVVEDGRLISPKVLATTIAEKVSPVAGEVEALDERTDNINERLETVEQLAEISIGGGDIGIATAEDFDDPTAAQRAKVPTVGAILDCMDEVPTPGSVKPVQSGGVHNAIQNIQQQIDGKFDYTYSSGYIAYSTGTVQSSQSNYVTSYIDISGCEEIIYTRLELQSPSSVAGMAFYDGNRNYISGQRCILNKPATKYVPTTIFVPENAKYARFTILGSLPMEDFFVKVKGSILDKIGDFNGSQEIQPSSVGASNGFWNRGVFTTSTQRVSFILSVENISSILVSPKSGYGVAVGKYSGYPSSSTYIEQESSYSENPRFVDFDESIKYIHCNIKKMDDSDISASDIADMILPIISYLGIGHKLNELETEISGKPSVGDAALLDFAISDNDGNQIVVFGEGHIKTKKFDSKSAVSFINKAAPILGNVKTINKTSIPSCLSKLAKIKNGDNAVLNLGMIGDSWTQGVGTDAMNRITYVKYLTRLLWEKYGYAGLGWFDFGYSNSDMKCADDTCISLTKSGTVNYVTRTSESLGIARSHAVFSSGASYTLTLVDANRPIDKAVIWFYNEAAFTYQVNDGEAIQVTATASGGWQSVTVNADITKIKITATADSTIIFGIDFSYGNKGVKVHKLGNRAATSTDFVEGTAASWEEGVSKLNLDILTEALYTNDRWIDNVAPAVVVANIKELFSRFKAVAPYADVVCIAPSNNYRSEEYSYTTEQYAFAMFDYCRENGYPFIDLIPLFGTKEQVQNLGLFYDNLHPNFAGANLIANYIFTELFNLF